LLAQCPSCSQKIAVDDSKVPDRPFSVKCPKCQNVVRLPGLPRPAGAPQPAEPDHPPTEVAASPPRDAGEGRGRERALVCLPDRAQAEAISSVLARLGLGPRSVARSEEGARILEQGACEVVVTNRGSADSRDGVPLSQRVGRLSPDARRRVFLVLVGNEFQTGDGTQAFANLADLVLHPEDLPSSDNLLQNTIADRERLYQVFLEARKRSEASFG